MRAKYYLSALALLATFTAQADYLFTTQFNSGRIPAVMSVEDKDGEPVQAVDYKNGFTESGWTVCQMQGAGTDTGASYAAVSPTHSRTDNPQENILSCPAVTLAGERPMLRWRACSVFPYFQEAYRVSLQEVDAETSVTLYETDAAPGQWTDYAVDLSAWNGKEVVISFTCVSVNKYMLAIDDIYIGDPEEEKFVCSVSSPYYVALGDGSATVSGTIENYGKPVSGAKLILNSGDTESTLELPADWQCGADYSFEFTVPTSLNEFTEYTITVEDAAGLRTAVYESKIFASYFPRNLFMEEFTGMWCNNCPEGQINVETLQRQFGEQLIPVTVHVNDIFQNTQYFESNRVYAVPWVFLNRNSATGSASPRYFDKEYNAPTTAMIEIADYAIEDDVVNVDAIVHWAEDIDNSSDRYRIGYTLTRDIYTTTISDNIYQKNSLTSVKSERYYFLPTRILSDLVPLQDVVISGEYSHTGVPYTLPEHITAEAAHQVRFSVVKPAMPEAVTEDYLREYDLKDCKLVAYLLDTESGQVLNAVAQPLDKPASVAISFPCEESIDQDNAEPEYYTLQGVRVNNPSAGIYIVRKGTKVSKQVIK